MPVFLRLPISSGLSTYFIAALHSLIPLSTYIMNDQVFHRKFFCSFSADHPGIKSRSSLLLLFGNLHVVLSSSYFSVFGDSPVMSFLEPKSGLFSKIFCILLWVWSSTAIAGFPALSVDGCQGNRQVTITLSATHSWGTCMCSRHWRRIGKQKSHTPSL